MRSVQNECGAGDNIVKCQEYMQNYHPSIVVIDDQMQFIDNLCNPDKAEPDKIKRFGYVSAETLGRVMSVQPLCMQIEYAHAMGNSPGFLQGYQDIVYKKDSNYIGGFAWEFKNHGFFPFAQRQKLTQNLKAPYLLSGRNMI